MSGTHVAPEAPESESHPTSVLTWILLTAVLLIGAGLAYKSLRPAGSSQGIQAKARKMIAAARKKQRGAELTSAEQSLVKEMDGIRQKLRAKQPLERGEQQLVRVVKRLGGFRSGRGGGAGTRPGASSRRVPRRPGPDAQGFRPTHPPLTPLTELGTGRHREFDGGLYGAGGNTMPAALGAAAAAASARIRPLGPDGQPSEDGRVAMICVGTVNARRAFARLASLIDESERVSKAVVAVPAETLAPDWRVPTLQEQLDLAGVTAAQVQVVWLKLGLSGATNDRNAAIAALQTRLAGLAQSLKLSYPHLRLCLLSSRVYSGLSPARSELEPLAYESAFAVRAVIQQQMSGEAALNHDPARGPVKAPVLIWGPYVWGVPRPGENEASGAWRPGDFELDGVHLSADGTSRLARKLFQFLDSQDVTRGWFLRQPR